MNRRDILKLFGVGAAAVPIVGGVVRREAEVVLVEAPKIEVARKLPSSTDGRAFYDAFLNRDQLEMRVDFYNRRTGEHFQIEAESFITTAVAEMIDVTTLGSLGGFREYARGPVINRWTLKGIMTGSAKIS